MKCQDLFSLEKTPQKKQHVVCYKLFLCLSPDEFFFFSGAVFFLLFAYYVISEVYNDNK